MDSNEGMLKIPEDQVLVEAPPEREIPPELNLNGTAPSLNGHLDNDKISNEQLYENDQKDKEHVEVSPDGTSTDQSNKSNYEEVTDSLGHGESITKGTSLLIHENEEPKEHVQEELEGRVMDDKMVHEDTLKTDNAVEQTVDPQQGQNLESAKATEDTKPASMSNIIDDEVVAKAPVGVQTPLGPNVDDSDALLDIIDGNTETVEPAKEDDVTHLDHKESSPEDKDSADHTDKVAEVEDQHSKQTDAVDADVVQEVTPKSKETDDPNVDDSDALLDTIDGNTEAVEPARADDVAHLDNKESSPEDKDIEEHTDEVAEEEDKHSKQTDAVDADVVQEEIPKSKETEVQEEMPKTEQADDSTIDAHVLNQELPEETNDPVHEKTEEISHQSSVGASEKTTTEHVALREPAVNVQEVQNQRSVEEMIDAEAVDTEKTMQQNSAAIEEEISEDHVATPATSSDIQHVHNVESEEIKGLEDAKAEETSKESNVAFAEDAVHDEVLPSETTHIQPVQGLEQEETENIGTVEMDEARNQIHPAVHNNLAQEDGRAESEPHVTELAEEVEDIEATETQEITNQCHAATSKELSTEDNSTASEPHNDDIEQVQEQNSVEVNDTEASETQGICHERTISTSEEDTVEDNLTTEGPICYTQEVQSVESPEQIKNNIAENITEASNATTVDKADQKNNVLTSEAIAEQQTRGLEPEEIKNTEPVEVEASDQRHAALFSDLAQEDNTTVNEMQKTEPVVETKEIEATKTKAIPQESNASITEEPNPEDIIIESETTSDSQEVNNIGSAESIEGNKDAKTEEISDYSSKSFAVEAVEGNNALESEANADIQPVQEMESEEMITKLVAVSETSHQMDDAVFQKSTQEDNPTASELHVMESAGQVSNIEATEAQATPHQTNVAQSEEQATEENTTANEPQILEPESVEEMDTDATEPEGISQQSIISTSEESVPEENVTEEEPAYDNKEVQNEEPELTKEHNDVKAEEISNQSGGAFVGEAAQENSLLASEPTNDVQVKGLESEDIRNIEDVGTEEVSHQTHVAAVKENLTASEPQMVESSEQMNGIEPIRPEPTLHESNIASLEEMATEDSATIGPDVGIQQLQEQESVQFRDIEAIEPQGISPSHIVSTSEESTPQDNVTATESGFDTEAENLESAEVIKDTEDVRSNVALAEEATPEEHVQATEATIDVLPVQELELEENKSTGPIETQDNIAASDLPAEEVKDTTETEAIPHESTVASISKLTEDLKSNVALSDEAASEEHILVAEATVNIPPGQQPELDELKNTKPIEVEETITASDLPAEEMKDSETMDTEAIPHASTVASIKELTEDGILTASATHADIQQVPEQESVEDMKCTATTEYQGEPQQNTVFTSDEHTPTEEKTTVTEPTCGTQVQNVVGQEIKGSEDVQTEQFFYQSTFCAPEVAAQESGVPRSEPTSDAQQVQEQDSTEESRGIEAVETEDHQQHGVSTLEKSVPENNLIESEPKVDDQQVQKEKSAVEVKDNEAMENEEISDQSNIITSENAAQESNELGSAPDFYVQSAQQLEFAEDSKGSQLVKAEETGQSNFATLEEPTAEDNATNEIGPPDDIKQEHEVESVEEIKDIDTTEAEDASHTSQAAALEEPPSESNIATTEPTYDIQQVNELEATKEMEATEAINDEEISCQQTEVAVLKDQSSTDNGTPPEELPVDLNEENIGDEMDNVMLVHEKIKGEMQESTEQKDEASNLGEKTVFTTQKGENITEVDGEDTIETSHNIDQIIEDPKSVTEHDSSQMSSDQREEHVTHVQDRDIKGELLTESGTEEVPQAVFENDPQAAQDVAEKDDTIKNGEEINDQDNEQHHDLVLQTQFCERSVDALAIGQQDEDVPKVNLDQQQKEVDEIEVQMEEIQIDEQKHDDKRADFTTEPLVEPQSTEVVTNRTENTDVFEAERTETVVTEMLKNEDTLHVLQESIPRITDAKVKNIMERKEGTEEKNELSNTGPLDADAETYNKDGQENTGKDAVVAKASADEQYETTDEIINEEVEPGLSSSVEKDLQEISGPAPSNDEIQENDLSIHHKVSDQNLAKTEHNGVEAEATQQKVDSPNAETNNDDILSISDPLPGHETGTESDINQNRQYQEAINADDVLQLGPEENAFDKIAETDPNEKMETFGEAVAFDEDTCNKASGADGALSDESLQTFEDTRRNLDVSFVVTSSKEESINEEMEDHKLALPAQPTLNENKTEQESGLEETERELSLSEKPLPAQPEEQEDSQITKEQDEEGMHKTTIGDTQKEAEESDLPVSNFLMNLIFGKESDDPKGNSESEAKKKQEETTNGCLITSQQEERLLSFPKENKVDDKLIFEQEKQNVEGSEETHETVKEQSHDFKLNTERSLKTDEELNRNTHDSETLVYQDNAQDEISGVFVPGEATGLVTEIEARDFKLDEKAVDTICHEDVEATTQIEEGILKGNLDDSTSPKVSQEDTLEEGRTELLHESLTEDGSSDAVAEQTLSLTEPDMGNAEKLANNTDGLQSPLCTKQEQCIESFNVEAKSTIEVQLESEEVDKKEENQHATTGGTPKEQVENLHDNSHKGTGSEAISDQQAPEITEPVSGTDIHLAHEKEISEGSTCMDKKESYNFSNNEKSLEFQSDVPNSHINQDKQDESVDSQIVIEKNNLLEKPRETDLQEQQETDTAQKSPKETDEGYQKFLVIKEPVLKEENVHETIESDVQTVPNEEQEVDSQVQECDLNVVSPKEAPGVEDSFVEITKPEFSMDEEQSPKADELNMAEEKTYGEKTKDEEEAKNFTDEATMKIEERGVVQKASHKKHNILSGVGSKVKHQLAKVKKAIIGKPGHTKSESPKS